MQQQKQQPSKEYITTLVNPTPVMAKCPKCEKHHIMAEANWTGNGMPRIYCPLCKFYTQRNR